MIQSYTSPHLRQPISPPHQAVAAYPHPSIERLEVPVMEYKSADYLLRYVISGEETIRQDYLRHYLREGTFLLVNPNQSLQIRPSSAQGSQSITFRISSGHTKESGWQTDSGEGDLGILLFEQVYEAEEYSIVGLIQEIVQSLKMGQHISKGQWKQYQSELGRQVWEIQDSVEKQIAQITSAKLSTRQELFRRLSKAKIHIHTHLHTQLDLDTLSQVACLSKFHFIRLFKEAFGLTPRQYLIGRRLDTASRLLIQSSHSFHEICQEVGLKDSSSFGRLFKRNFGTTPHMYRQLNAVS